MKVKNITVIFLFLFAFTFPLGVSAQLYESANIFISPENPGPQQEVRVRVTSNSTNIDQATVTWFLNGSIALQGKGYDEFSFETKGVGISSTVKVVIEAPGGILIEETRAITPTEVVVLAEALTETPSLYKGRALQSPGSLVRFIALPNIIQGGRKYRTNELVFTWYNQSQKLKDLSGTGKNQVVLKNPGVLRDFTLSVEVETPLGLIGEGSATIPVDDPEVYVYEDDPLLGIRYDRALSTFDLQKEELQILSVPYFFSGNNLTFNWKVDGKSIEQRDRSITLRPQGVGGGVASIQISIDNIGSVLQEASQLFKVSFGETSVNTPINTF